MQTALIILYALLIIQSAFLILIGLKILAVNKTPDIPPKPLLKPLFKPKEKETEEQRKERILLENIEAYDGTGRNQQKL
jgi:uncharacterized protein YxeA